MKLPIQPVKGMIPVIDPVKLPADNATLAINANFDTGSLTPYAQLTDLSATAVLALQTKSLFLYLDTHWFSWSGDVHAVPSPINNDTYDRVYYTGDGAPKVTSSAYAIAIDATMPDVKFRMGVKQPIRPVIAEIIDNEEDAELELNNESRFYVTTFVNEWGEEGLPSPPSVEVVLNNPDASFRVDRGSIGTNDQNIKFWRLYRSNGLEYQLVSQFLITDQPTQIDDLVDSKLGVVLDSYNYSEPIQTMQGLTSMANGILVGFDNYTVCFSEQYLPHAWPTDYQQTTEFPIVAIAAFGNSVVVGTTGNPYLFSGVSPDSVSGIKLEIAQSCVSVKSMVDMGNYVIYASPDGLVAISSNQQELVTAGLINKEVWNTDFNGGQFEAVHYEGKYFAFGSRVGGGFIFDPRNKNLVYHDIETVATFNDLKRDALYLVQGITGRDLYSFDSGASSLTYEWHKNVRLNHKPLPSCVFIDTDDPAQVSFELKVDGTTVADHSDLSALPDLVGSGQSIIRLPSIRGVEFDFKVSGTSPIHGIVFGSTVQEAYNG